MLIYVPQKAYNSVNCPFIAVLCRGKVPVFISLLIKENDGNEHWTIYQCGFVTFPSHDLGSFLRPLWRVHTVRSRDRGQGPGTGPGKHCMEGVQGVGAGVGPENLVMGSKLIFPFPLPFPVPPVPVPVPCSVNEPLKGSFIELISQLTIFQYLTNCQWFTFISKIYKNRIYSI